jgi:chromosome segregation ATPase
MFGLPSLYVALAALALFAGLAGYGVYEKQRGDIAAGRALSAEALVSQYKTDLAESEANNAVLRDLQKRLDVAVKERDKRAADLRKALGELDAQYEQLEKNLAPEDKACLSRALPDSIASRLREPEPDSHHQDGDTAGP